MSTSSFELILTFNHEAGYYVPNQNHMYYELVYYVSGTGNTTINNQNFDYSPGTFTLISPKTIHNEAALTPSRVSFIGFNYDSEPFEKQNCLFNDTEEHTIFNLMKEISSETEKRKRFYQNKINLLVEELIIELHRMMNNDETESTEGDEFESIVKHMNLNFQNDFDYEMLASLCGYSYDWFRHKFKSYTGMSPKQYVINMRINYAKKMLKETDKKISAIAAECCFQTASQFIQKFRETTGITPNDYRQRSRQ